MRVRILVLALLAAVVGVAAPARAATPTVGIQAASHVTVAGTSITFHGSWSGWQNPTVAFVVEAVGKPTVVVPMGENGPGTGSQDFVLAPVVNTRVTLKVSEGSTVQTAPWQMWVRPRIATSLHTGYTRSGAYYVMGRGVSPPFRSATYPKRPGQMCLRHQVQRYRDGAWRNRVLTACKVEDARGRVSWTWAGSHPSRVRFRVRAMFPGDSRNIAGNGPWLYFKFR